jgi:hypothetical protein
VMGASIVRAWWLAMAVTAGRQVKSLGRESKSRYYSLFLHCSVAPIFTWCVGLGGEIINRDFISLQ